MTTYEKWLLLPALVGAVILLFLLLDALLARPTYVSTRLIEPGSHYIGGHRPEVIGGQS